MEFEHLFSILSVFAAGLFFAAGFSAGWLKRAQTPEGELMAPLQDDFAAGDASPREAALRETAAREIAASEANARESAARQATADAESARLRTEARAATAEIARLKARLAALEQRDDAGSLKPMAIESHASPTSFQGILAHLSKTKGIRAAVIGDALGLPVASFGDQSESLAGCCGFISQAAGKARDFLQLEGIRRIVIEDERLATLTACSVSGTDLFLATLTSGPGPEFSRMVQVLNEVKSFMSQRSQSS
jgi:predicted regulator of Ras-like GTPase activity (Roadblock/LC7/MglB family)